MKFLRHLLLLALLPAAAMASTPAGPPAQRPLSLIPEPA